MTLPILQNARVDERDSIGRVRWADWVGGMVERGDDQETTGSSRRPGELKDSMDRRCKIVVRSIPPHKTRPAFWQINANFLAQQ